ncbi:MAG TPA: alpha/beta hydrolase [Candidatus Limnocylindrales bacterium]|nr:alpha/beta hydrolase [Candidatus Limnocylindrales bacterium]
MARQRSRSVVIALVAFALLLLSILPATVSAKPALGADARPTIVLVHGSWAGPSGWDQVVAGLQKDGYDTETPTLDLATLSGDVATVRATLDAITGDKILVGHSYGGMVVSGAAAGRSDVRALVYTAAFVPDVGETAFGLLGQYPPSEAFHHLVFAPFPYTFIDPAFFPQVFCQDLSPKRAAALNADQRATSLAVGEEPAGPAAWHALPSWYAISGQDRIIPPALQTSMSARAGATVVTYDDASHAGGFTHYASRFVKLIEEAVTQTAD